MTETATLNQTEQGNQRTKEIKGCRWESGLDTTQEVSEREGIIREESIKGKLNRSDDRLLLLSSKSHST